MGKLNVFLGRMKKLGIDVKLIGNYPWIYIDTINGNKIKEEDFYYGNHGYTIAFMPTKIGEELEFIDITKTINLIKKYRKNT
jgi:hypothetical protein